jgi:formate-dependent nitrite reductase membrane component NrfD
MDHKYNGMFQRDWSWQIAIYLFLGGVGGGAYAIAALNRFLGEGLERTSTVGLWIAFPALLIGTAFLVADLGTPRRAFLAAMKPGTSWISRGTIIISIFMLLSFLHLVLDRFTTVDRSAGGSALLDVISVVATVFAVGTMAYTGILLGASKGVPFWQTGVVPVVFVISALVTGHFAILLGVVLFPGGADVAAGLRTMSLEAVALVVLEVLAIVFFLQAAFRLPDSRESAERILRRRSFVLGYIVLGLAAPAAIMAIVYGAAEAPVALAAVGAVLGLIGGLILRQAVLACGALPTMNMAGFKFRRIHRPKEPKPGIGLLPPS